MALHATLAYCLWYKKNFEELNDGQEFSLDLVPEIKIAFERRLDRNIEKSPSIHSFFGQSLTTLFWLDYDWTTANLIKILAARYRTGRLLENSMGIICAF